MGQEIDRTRYSEADFQRFQRHLARETRDLIDFADAGGFADTRLVAGLELEAWLLDHAGYPSPINQEYLSRLANPLVVPELSRFNVELNSPPLSLAAGAILRQERELAAIWGTAQQVAHELDACLGMIGIPPTIRAEDLTLANMSALNRFVVLNEQVLSQRGGEAVHIHVAGEDALDLDQPDVMLEAATTSFQLHLQVPEAASGRYYNAALMAAAPILAVATNSPLLFGKRLWQETRIPLFEQSVELGGYTGLADANVRRVTFGQGYLEGSLLDLFQRNLEQYPVLLPMALSAEHGRFAHVRLHNGSIWRWVRPLIGFDGDGVGHVRIEQRVLPSGPTLLDMMANAAFSHGLTHALATAKRAPEECLGFESARANFYAAARSGLQSHLRWLEGEMTARDLVLQVCLPLAESGLASLGLESGEIDRYLSVISARATTGQTGAVWLLRRHDRLQGDLERLMADYLENQRTGLPVHEWDA